MDVHYVMTETGEKLVDADGSFHNLPDFRMTNQKMFNFNFMYNCQIYWLTTSKKIENLGWKKKDQIV